MSQDDFRIAAEAICRMSQEEREKLVANFLHSDVARCLGDTTGTTTKQMAEYIKRKYHADVGPGGRLQREMIRPITSSDL